MSWLMRGINAPRAPVFVALLVLLGALALRIADPAAVTRLRDFAFDSYQRIQPRTYNPETPVRIVDIDEASLQEFGQWPWPRTIVARLVDKLTEKGAVVVAFDAVFAEPDRSSISRMVRDLVAFTDPETVQKLAAAVQDNDKVLADAMAQSRVVAGFGFDVKGTGKPPRTFHGVAFAGDQPSQFLPQQGGTVKSIDILEAAAKGNGSVNTDVDSIVIRRVPMMFRVAGYDGLFPALSIEALRVAQEASTYLIKSSGASGEMSFGEKTGIVAIRTGNLEVPTDARGRLIVYDTGHKEERFISARAILNDEVPAEKIEGNVFFVGTSAIGLKDLRNTPVQDAVPGVELHAQLAEQMLEQKFLARPDYADGAEFLYLAIIGLLLVVLLPRLSAGKMAVVATIFIGIGLAVPWIAYSNYQLLFDPIYPPVTFAAIYVGGTALAFMRTERERAEIRGAFGMYLSPDLVEQLARNPSLLQLGGEQREITVMFTDVRGFTTISEQFDPQGLTRFMNRFLTPMTDLILGLKGTIDKYMGDAIMAFWNAPLPVERHAARACDAALAMQARLAELNEEWKAEAIAEGRKHIPVNIGVGLNTGPASVGNFGSTQRFTYSCLGDDVNLASRLEGQCKTYGVGIIIGRKTREAVEDYATAEIDLITVKGKTEPERVFALLGDPAVAQTDAFRALQACQDEFLRLYRTGGFAEALEMIGTCQAAAETAGWRQTYYEMMRGRLDALIDDSPVDWKGVYVAKDK
ncbi:adenylate/guanylate cyclase domain-containing protein [Reyranella sp. MMS21-HV4-11]|uniref:Adenylate/guanylate cyclase domain-containing protein n=1 Tax=Reyranella humidisoli TaxID=2849149 RepID=A0ABS6IMB0_9HYPH|nr:adenylate/guanylate cyclase domain-containing protein [Reyranella sp. MMS21-HV4-11]MBU8875729.1 adenylate/guanylate cyclase domain-containing protein [Reyranella sp. MMS21-HV4-11]